MKIYVTDFGAIPNSPKVQTACFQAAIDFLADGGEVIVPGGYYITGDIRLRSNITLHLLENAVIMGSTDPNDYTNIWSDNVEPLRVTSFRGKSWIPIPLRDPNNKGVHIVSCDSRWNNGLIRAVDACNITVIGEEGACFDGVNCYDPLGEEGYRGPHCFNFHRCQNVTFKGYSVKNSGNWAHCIFDSNHIVFEDVVVFGGHDGIHLRGCDNVQINDCSITTGDDCIAGFDNNYIEVRDCRFSSACSAFRFGGTHIRVEDCVAIAPCDCQFRGGFTDGEKQRSAETSAVARRNMLSFFTYIIDKTHVVRNAPDDIVFADCYIENADRFIHLNLSGNESWQEGVPPKSLTFSNITAKGIAMGATLYGDGTIPFELKMTDVEFISRDGCEKADFLRLGNFGRVVLDNVTVKNYQSDALIRTWTDGEIVITDLDCDGFTAQNAVKASTEEFTCNAI